ncbi:hypothetical protein N7G274_008004 [Stereocaulon virgatum]|uniref:WD40 repeat-like protein n=1 Tax=Stereocaulon virgatum TaxID=373712 RepID=A0ABR4A331_9LECA
MEVATLTDTSSLSLPPDSYIYKILQVDSKIAAISSDNSLRVIDSTSLKEIRDGIIDNVHAGVTCLEALRNDRSVFWTAGRDAVVRSWDLRLGKSTLDLSDDSNAPYLSLCVDDHCIVVGTELSHTQATVILWDNRAPGKPIRRYIESHNDDVTELQFHPQSRGTLLSGSTDGLVNIYNTAEADEDEALSQVANHGSSIHHAGFLSNSHFFALSHDETFSVYHLESQDDSALDVLPQVCGDIRPKLQCEYVVSVIPYIGSGKAILGVGSLSQQNLDLVPLRYADTWSFDLKSTIRLPGAHGEDIVRSMCTDHDTVFTAGEDGLIRAWRADTEQAQKHMQGAEATTENDKRKQRKRKDHAAGGDPTGRFKPY